MKTVLIGIVVVAAIIWTVTLLRAASHEARAEATHPPQGQILDVNGHRVHAQVMGSGPDIVLIHGASGNLRDMTLSLAPKLAERYRVISFDRPGLGYTDGIDETGASLAQQAELLSSAAQILNAEKPIVVGHSYGGAVALAWAVHHPDRLSALVPLAAASNPWDTPLDPLYRVTSHPIGSALVVPLITAFVPDRVVENALASTFLPQSPPDGYQDHFGPGLTLRRGSMRANATQRANLLDEIKTQVPLYAEIAVPTEIIHGTADTTVSLHIHSEKLVEQIPDATLTRLDGIGHMPHHSAETDVVAAIDRAANRAGLR